MRIVPWVLLFSVGGAGSAAQVAFPAFNGNVGVGTTNAPYSAKQTVVRTQTAANGQKFTTTQVSLLWRDSEGRIRQEDLLKRLPVRSFALCPSPIQSPVFICGGTSASNRGRNWSQSHP